jgi:hypothetical protein
MTRDQRERLVDNIAAGLSQTPRHIQECQLQHFNKAGPAYGGGVARAVGIRVEEPAATKQTSATIEPAASPAAGFLASTCAGTRKRSGEGECPDLGPTVVDG